MDNMDINMDMKKGIFNINMEINNCIIIVIMDINIRDTKSTIGICMNCISITNDVIDITNILLLSPAPPTSALAQSTLESIIAQFLFLIGT